METNCHAGLLCEVYGDIKEQHRTGEPWMQEVEAHDSRSAFSKKQSSNWALKKEHSDWSGGKDLVGRGKASSTKE